MVLTNPMMVELAFSLGVPIHYRPGDFQISDDLRKNVGVNIAYRQQIEL